MRVGLLCRSRFCTVTVGLPAWLVGACSHKNTGKRRTFKVTSAFALGTRTTSPNARTIVSYIGNWDDISARKEQAIPQISQNADIIFQNADAAGLKVFQAANTAKPSAIK